MEGWTEICRIAATASTSSINNIDQASITTLQFDNVHNLLWCGDSKGYTRSFTSQSSTLGYQAFHLYPYTKFKVSKNNPIIQHLNHRDGILSLSQNNINFNTRRGLAKLSLTAESFEDGSLFTNLSCMTINCNTNNDIVVGGSQSLFKFDINKPNVLSPFNHSGNLSFINHSSKFLTLGRSNGTIEIFDPTSNQSVKSFHGHNGLLSDLDIQGNYVATCGYSVRPRRYNSPNEYVVDPLVNIYDLRMMRPLAPIPFPAGASFVRFHPKLPNIIIIASTTGQIQFVDIYEQSNVYLYQANLLPATAPTSNANSTNSYLSNLEISENGEFFCFSDGYSNLHLWSFSSSNKDFLNFPSMTEQPDLILPPQTTPIGVDDIVPLSSIGMPYYKDLLLSNYASDLKFTKELAKLPKKLDQDLIVKESSGFFPYNNLKYGPRNIVNKYQSLKDKNINSINIPKFISERNNGLSKTTSNSSADLSFNLELTNEASDEAESIFQCKVSPPSSALLAKSVKFNKIPNCYSKLQIQYSKFGVEDFDFDYYNKTNGLFCGLENHLDNSYINSLIQLYRYSPIFYNLTIKNLLKEWAPNDINFIMENPQGSSILNELGYLFDMMYKSQGRNVKISNFSQVLNENKIAIQEGLINIDDGKNLNSQDLRNIVVHFNKFLINQLNQDLIKQFNDFSLNNIMSVDFEIEIHGSSCQTYEKQIGSQLMIDLVAPPPNVLNKLSILINPNNQSIPTTTKKNHSILTYLEYSLNQFKIIPCQQHQYVHNLEIKTNVIKLPPLLTINLSLSNEESKVINNFKKWLIPEFYATSNNKKINLKPVITQFNQDIVKYELLGYMCEINHDSDSAIGSHNLVSYIKINDQWYLFNDFLVMPIPEEEVFNLSYPWKKPTILFYHDVENSNNKSFNYFDHKSFINLRGLDDSILYRDHFAGAIRESHKKEYELLIKEEAPSFGSLVAIDAEFVTLQPEEIEVSYDGYKNLMKPKKLSLARISVLRGDNGPKQGIAFIDDYIIHTCTIHDYLTNFSGIEPGDLDPIRSQKNLVTLQTAYRKLWLLLNLGVVFVGHGLKNDFRCINLQVPQQQIRDTAEFYYKSDFKRKLSLKFLAYILLKEKVQTGNHDSIEDAYTALLLYKKYIELNAVGEFDSNLNHIYLEGQQLRFKVPE